MSEITIDSSFQDVLTPLSDDEYKQLQSSIQREGCRDPLVVWAEEGILLDGHNRYKICADWGLEFNVTYLSFETYQQAYNWIVKNQLARRNLTPLETSFLRGCRYNSEKNAVPNPDGLNQHSEVEGQNDPQATTAERIGQELGVSEKTIKRDGSLASDILTLIDRHNPKLKNVLLKRKSPTVTRKGVKRLRKFSDDDEVWADKAVDMVLDGEAIPAAIREASREKLQEELDSIEAREAKEISGVYDVIVIDPPWEIKKIERDVAPRQSGLDYPTMSLDELAEMRVPCADDCHVFVWTTQKFLPSTFDLLKDWELRYVCTFVWHKPGGFQPHNLPQYNCEFVLYARRGTPKFVDTKDFSTCFNAERGMHSEKPESFYSVLRRVTAGRRLDMFNRRDIEGFDGWGNESE